MEPCRKSIVTRRMTRFFSRTASAGTRSCLPRWIYYTAYYFLRDDRTLFANKGVETLKIAVALALGIALVCSIPLKRRKS